VKLYGYWRSSASYRVRLALNLKGIAYDYEPVNLPKDEQKSPAYLARSPQGLVPALATDDGATLTQSTAIIEYLEEVYPSPALLPEGAVARARARAIASAIACEAQPFGNLRILNYLRDEAGFSDEKRLAFLNRWAGGTLNVVEKMVRETAGAFCLGDTPTLADIYLAPQLARARRFLLDLSGCKTLLAIDENCARLPAFINARPDNQKDAVKS
jgi:maleylacetoacetate isomerase